MMKKFTVWILAGMIVISLIVTGCGGGGAKVQTSSAGTLGQELIDLEKAYKQGVISEKEYNSAKNKLLKAK